MHIAERRVASVLILDARGQLTTGSGNTSLKDNIDRVVHQGYRNVILNLEDVPVLDSAGIGQIVGSYTMLSRAGGTLKLLGLSKAAHDLLKGTKLLTVIETFDTEEDAVRSFPAAR